VNKLGPISVGGSNPVRIMGILNVSPESFFKRSIKINKEKIIETIKKMEKDGADFVDVGGMSTAPYLSTTVSEDVESNRVIKTIKIIQQTSNLPISVDTCRAKVARSALELGVNIINDISGLKFDNKMVDVIKKYQPSVVLCAFSKKKVLGNPLKVTKDLLRESIALAKSANISPKKIVLDPAIGFFRTSGKGKFFTKINLNWVDRDVTIIKNLKEMRLGQPILISVSNKSFLGKLLKKENPSDRLFGSLAAETVSVLNGADIIRTHNVKQTQDAITIAEKLAH